MDRRIVYASIDGRLFSLDSQTGRPCQGFGNSGAINLRERVLRTSGLRDATSVTSPPAIYKDLVITGAGLQEIPSKGPSGAVRAFDARTGQLVWRFDTVPGPGQIGHDTWEADSWKDRSGTNAWSIMSVDVERGIVFLPPLGSPSYDFYGADRKGTRAIRQLTGGVECRQRQAPVVLPDGTSRSLGLRPAGAAQSGDPAPRGTGHSSGSASN